MQIIIEIKYAGSNVTRIERNVSGVYSWNEPDKATIDRALDGIIEDVKKIHVYT